MIKKVKKSYFKILAIELVFFFALFINSFLHSYLNNYGILLLLLLMGIAVYFTVGFEKDKYRFKKDIYLEIIEISIVLLLLYYISGLITGFAKTPNFGTIGGFFSIILPTVLIVFTEEFIRNGLMRKTEYDAKMTVITVVTFIMLDLTAALSVANLQTAEAAFKFIALSVLPVISTNVYLSYLTRKVGYKPAILYSLIFKLYPMVLPIIPNPTEYIVSIIGIVFPAIFLYLTWRYLKKEKIFDEKIKRDYRKKRISIYAFPAILIAIFVYFISGYFKLYAIAVASGSMSPEFERGAVVIVDQSPPEIKEGEIIAFKAENKIVVHRIIRIVPYGDQNFYYTKGDANEKEDNYQIRREDIVGVVRSKIPYIGYPTVLFSEL